MDIFGALADPVRRSLLTDLAASRPISRPAVSRHLRLLREAGAVTVTERGRERYYAVDRAALGPVSTYVAGLLARPPRIDDGVLEALATEVRRTVRDRRRSAPHDHEETA